MIESDAGYSWLAAHVATATALSADEYVWKLENPGGIFPVIILTPGSLTPVSWNGGRTPVMQRQEWNIVVIDKGNDDTRCANLAEAIYSRLRFRTSEAVPSHGCWVLSCLAGPELDYTDRDANGTVYHHRGNLFTVLIKRN